MITLTLATRLTRQYTRNVLLLALLAVVPFVFITLSYYTTQGVDISILVTEHGQRQTISVWMPDLHGAVMVPITAAFLAGIAGLFVMLEARRADSRLVVAGVSAWGVAAACLLMILAFGVIVALISVGVTLISYRPDSVAGFVGANVILAVTYGFVGALVSLLAGRLGGAYLMLFIPMMDVGIFQDPMFVSGEQATWMKLLPGFGGTRFAIDAAFSGRADDWPALAAAVAWALGAGAVTMAIFAVRARG